jgi:hypothetical protein
MISRERNETSKPKLRKGLPSDQRPSARSSRTRDLTATDYNFPIAPYTHHTRPQPLDRPLQLLSPRLDRFLPSILRFTGISIALINSPSSSSGISITAIVSTSPSYRAPSRLREHVPPTAFVLLWPIQQQWPANALCRCLSPNPSSISETSSRT